MRALALDFRPRLRAGVWIGSCILVLGLIAAGSAILRFQWLEQRREGLEASMREKARAQPGARAAAAAPASIEEAKRRSNARRAVVRALGRPWDELFADIESATHEQIALLALEPDVRRAEVRLAGEARNAEALADYVAALERTPALSAVNLTQHEMVAEGGESVLRFMLVGAWRPGT